MRIWIDADAAPREVKETIFKAAKRLSVEAVLVANQWLTAPPGNPFVSVVRVQGGMDVADRYIAEQAEPGDLAVTVEKQVLVIDPRGEEYTEENVGDRLAVRDLMDGLRGTGMLDQPAGGPRPYSPKDRQAFSATLDRLLTRALRSRKT
jgi:uncharacterized protein